MPLPLALLAASPLIAKLGTAIVGLGSAAATGYSIYRNQKDIDYQKSLQNDIFNREDNAVQRRMNDLQAAGLNPNLAAGSAAGAGAVVGRSNTPGINGNPLGDALDFAQHVAQLEAQHTENRILNNQEKMSDYYKDTAHLQNVLDQAQLLWQLGIKDGLQLGVDSDGNWNIRADTGHFKKGLYNISAYAPIFHTLEWQYQNNRNSADLLQKENQWYNAKNIVDVVGQTARSLGGIGSFASGIGNAYRGFNYQAPNYNTYNNSRNFYTNPYIKNNW